MASQFPQRPLPPPSSPPTISPTLFQHRRFWLKIAAYRPLLVLAGIWFVLLLVAVAAYERLTYAVNDAPPQVAASDVTVYPHQRGTSDLDTASPESSAPADNADDADAENADTSTQTEATSQTAAISPWSLGALVAACALGCIVVSKQLQTPPRPRQKRQKRVWKSPRSRSAAPKLARSAVPKLVRKPATSAGPERLAPYDPTQPLVVASAPQRMPKTPKPETPKQPAADVTVVPDDTAHPLDWPEDSLINTVDIRQQRSLSSLL